MNALEVEYLCLHEISINAYKLFIAVIVLCLRCPCSVAYLFVPYYNDVVVAYLLLYLLFFILMLMLYFCLFVDHVNKPITFVFSAFYLFNNTISIVVII